MGGAYNLRHLGMIATSPSWRRWFLPVMWRAASDYLGAGKGRIQT